MFFKRIIFESHCVELIYFKMTIILLNRCVSARNNLPSFIVKSKYVASFKRTLITMNYAHFKTTPFSIAI